MKVLWILCAIWFWRPVTGQDYPRQEVDVSKLADALFSTQDDDADHGEHYENLIQLLSSPLNLNTASVEQLRFLHILSESQLNNFVDYRNEYKTFLSVYELQAIPEFDQVTIAKLAAFVIVPDPDGSVDALLLKRIYRESENYFMARVERTFPSQTESFNGSPEKLYLRFRSSRTGDFSFGFTAEKDPGEALDWKPKKHIYGFDYLSFHIQLQNKGRLKNLIVGDFQSQFGQGLMLGGAFGTGKGSETVIAVRRSNIGLLPYTSVYEAGFLRGIASTIEISSHIFLSTYFSSTRRDAVTSDSLDTTISTLQTTGLHRNTNELADRKKIKDTNYGAVLEYKTRGFEGGVMYTGNIYSIPIIHDPRPYNQFSFRGRENQNIGIFINFNIKHATFFNEITHTLNNGLAFLTGVLISPTPALDIALLYRRFDRNFHALYSNAFSENTIPQNEHGLYWGWKYKLNRKFSVAGYIDYFEFPWLRYRAYAPAAGYEWLLKFAYQPSRSVLLFVQAREESKDRNVSNADVNGYTLATGKKNNFWIHVESGLRQKLRFRSRAQFSTYRLNGHTTAGLALMQDVVAEVGKFQLTGRYAVFNTDDYDNRQYAFENDVLLAYSMPAYFGVGVRKVIMVRYKINRQLSVWLRYGNTRYPNQEKIGSGPDAIEGNIRNDVKFQFRITF